MDDFNLKSILNSEKNVEEIRRKNLEENQLFLEQLRMTDIRNDFINSARSILREKENIKKPIEYKKIEYTTRYNRKVKSGEIPPHIPEWVRKNQRKLLGKEQLAEEQKRKLLIKEQKQKLVLEEQKRKLLVKEQKRKLLIKEQKQKLKEKRLKKKKNKRNRYYPPPKWMLSYPINGNSYHRVFKPRYRKISERVEQEFNESLE